MFVEITESTADELCHEDEGTVDGCKIIEQAGDWCDEGKYAHKETIFEKDGVTYELSVGRSGSYFTEYHYEFQLKCPQVRSIENIVRRWVPVKEEP